MIFFVFVIVNYIYYIINCYIGFCNVCSYNNLNIRENVKDELDWFCKSLCNLNVWFIEKNFL